jgi:hypothetical protein
MFEPLAAIDALAASRAKYIVVGGWAASHHGAARLTEDLDICPEFSLENLDRVAEALRALDARVHLGPGHEPYPHPNLDGRTLRGMELSTWETTAGSFDVVHHIPVSSTSSLRSEHLAQRQRNVLVRGRFFAIASLEHIVASKQHIGRPKDLEALPELRGLLDQGRGLGC